MDFEAGQVLYFDKPLTWTSFNLVAKVRWLLCRHLGVKKLKVGHAGTLDPLATGVLIVCTGKATKQIDQLQARTKEYVATLQLGQTTPSYDLETQPDATYPTSHITPDLIRETMPRFMGRIEQVPPAFSAVKIDGHRAYNLARKGGHEEVEKILKPKELVIDELEVLSFDAGRMQLTLRVVCSKGTYIRALARDIGQALGSGAHLTALRRTRIGDVGVDKCLQIADFEQLLEENKANPI